jgi:hypothetical protein
VYVQRNIVARSRNHCSRGKAISIVCYERVCILALVFLHANGIFLCSIIMSLVACLVLPYFYTFSKKKITNFGHKVIEYKMCVLNFSTTSARNISHSKNNSAIYYHKCTSVSMLCTCYSNQVLLKLELSRKIFEKFCNIKFHENPSREIRVVLCDQTDTTKLIAAFRNFAYAPKSQVPALQRQNCVSTVNTKQLMLFREFIAVLF